MDRSSIEAWYLEQSELLKEHDTYIINNYRGAKHLSPLKQTLGHFEV